MQASVRAAVASCGILYRMILFLSDFGPGSPYVGQVRAVLAARAPGVPAVDLMHDLPAFRPAAAGCLLAALMQSLILPASRAEDSILGAVVLAVVDPGVGGDRLPIIVEAGPHRYVGPDNGLFGAVLGRVAHAQAWRIDWRPDRLSASFHGRDLFAPVVAMLTQGQPVPSTAVALTELRRPDGPDPLAEVVYVDRYGNAMTGLDTAALPETSVLETGGHQFRRAGTFGDDPDGAGFWYANSLGLAELAVNRASAADRFGLTVGTPVAVVS